MSVKEFFQDYGWLILTVSVLIVALVFVFTGSLFESSLDSDENVTATIEPVADNNLSVEHIALANNQQVILDEIQKLNLFSQCTIDTNSIRTVEVPIDNAGAFRRVSLITLICPELN
ncbi:hypothetical protein LCGC14_1819560 [marine sediment metagenome]|uniref:Uncharacterized protein n=1 Tax=marine sediment metagenome TaxID=412755 RepID=A0A0F9H7H5_9ZZZZ